MPAEMERARLMRWVICAAVVLAFAPSAFAADLDDNLDVLRGTETVGPAKFTRWSGFYFGGQASYSDASADFSKATQPLLAFSLRELALEADDMPSAWPVLGSATSRSTGFGGFVGYNSQWQDLVLGIEANYTHSPFSITGASFPISRVVSAGSNLYSVNIDGSGSLNITDYGSLRARAGWIFDNFLPYGFAGFALGRGSYTVTSFVSGQQSSATPPAVPVIPCDPADVTTCVGYSYGNGTSKSGAFLYGYSIGGGLEVALTSNIFLRGEYEFIQFVPIANISASISTVRVGAGLKF